jgi:hypothetical protein
MPEYALLLFAVLISAAAATKRIGPRVAFAGDTTRRILMGENIEASNTGTAIGGMVLGASGSSNGGSASGSSGSASSAGGSSSVAAASGGGGSLGGATTDFLGGSSSGSGASSGSASGSSGGGGSSVSANIASVGGGIVTGVETTEGLFGSSAPSPANAQSAANEAPRGFLGGTGAPAFASQSSASGASQNTVNPALSSTSGSSSEGAVQGDGYTISAAGEKQMQALLAQAKANADGKRPLGQCYHVVKTDIDEVGYGDLAKMGNTAFPKQLPSSDQEYVGYGGSKNFPAGNNYVLGIYAPK